MKPLTVPGKLESLESVANYVLEAAAMAQLDKGAAYRLRLAVDEIVTNVVTHGYDEAGLAGMLTLSAELRDQALAIHLEDTGRSYNPSQSIPPANLDWPLERRQPGGLGVYLALRGVDQFYYERCAEGNRSTFIVKRPPHPS